MTTTTLPRRVGAHLNEVHVWRGSLASRQVHVVRDYWVLDDQERGRADRFLRDVPRRRFIVARAGLRRLLGCYLQIDPREVRLTSDSKGKPRLAVPRAGDLRFNVSHAEDAIVYAIARGREVGVDIERVREDLPVMGIAEQFFAPEEIAALHALPAPARVQAFFVCWTRKEAYLKATGEGLSFGPERFAVGIASDGRGTLLNRNSGNGNDRWSIESLNLSPGYTGAVVAEGTDWRLLRYDMTSAFCDVSRPENSVPTTSAGAR